MATIVETLETISNGLSRPAKFFYVSDLFEFNLLADQILNAEYPICIVLEIVVTDTPGTSGILKSSFPLQAYFLDQKPTATIDFKTSEIDRDYITPMRNLAREFIHKLNENDIIDPESPGIQQRSFDPEFSLADAHLFGVLVRCNVPVMEGVTGCVS